MDIIKLSKRKIRLTRNKDKRYTYSYYFNIYININKNYKNKTVKAYLMDKKIYIDFKDKPSLFKKAKLLGTYTISIQNVNGKSYNKIRLGLTNKIIKRYGIKDEYYIDKKLPYITIYLQN